jgi:restriction system protein
VAIPDFQTLMLPLLTMGADGKEHPLLEAREVLASKFGLTEQERNELLPSGRQRRFNNRVAWAKVYLEQAGLVTTPKRGRFLITEAGRKVLLADPPKIDIGFLDQFDSFREFRGSGKKADSPSQEPPSTPDTGGATPEEQLEAAYQSIRTEVTSGVLSRVKSCSPQFFEKLVVELLLKMGYGGSLKDAGKAIGAAGDEGIDGIINEDRLGLDVIYIQAKRWEGTVGRPDIQKFVGALHGKRAKKGVFLTTSSFSAEARDYVSHIDPRVILIDGRLLAEYMLDFGLGVTSKATYDLKAVDTDYFVEE